MALVIDSQAWTQRSCPQFFACSALSLMSLMLIIIKQDHKVVWSLYRKCQTCRSHTKPSLGSAAVRWSVCWLRWSCARAGHQYGGQLLWVPAWEIKDKGLSHCDVINLVHLVLETRKCLRGVWKLEINGIINLLIRPKALKEPEFVVF